MTGEELQQLESLFGEAYRRASDAQAAVRALRTGEVLGITLSTEQKAAREEQLKADWGLVKTQLLEGIDAVLGA